MAQDESPAPRPRPRYPSCTARWQRTPMSPSGTAPTMPTRTPPGDSATAQRASRTPRSRLNALGSAAQRTTLLSFRMRRRSASSICRMRTPESGPAAWGGPLRTFVPSTFTSSLVAKSDMFPSISDVWVETIPRGGPVRTGETRTPRARSLEDRSGQGWSRKPSDGTAFAEKPRAVPFHAHHATTPRPSSERCTVRA